MAEDIQDQPAPGDTPLEFSVELNEQTKKIEVAFSFPVNSISFDAAQAARLAAILSDGVSKLLNAPESAILVPGHS